MVGMIMAMVKSVKPIVLVVRGSALGISFTKQSHATFIYCSPEAKWQTPFMSSSQTQEGCSTYLFPQIFGTRYANEILLCDRAVTAQDAVRTGFANGIINTFDPKSDWFDPNIIPVIPKLLAADYLTLVTCMQQFNASKDIAKVELVTKREADALVNHWMHPDFIPKMFAYLKTF